ncbi:hypothetical protein FRC12_020818 [Ceratobasidium sp. 428]|nr:hypothetical protein FRC12_020818 [Ceratobasidium sp. 428]
MVHTLGRTTRGEEQVQVSQEPPRKRPSIPKIARQDRLVTGVSRSVTVPTAPSAEQGDLDRAVPPLERAFGGIRNISVESPESSSQGLAQLAQLAGAALATIATVISPGSPQSDPGKPEPDNTPEPDLVSGSMSITKIMEHLIKHGCKNVTSNLDLLKCSEYPIAGGGFGDVYRGRLQDGSPVAIKCSRLFIENIQDMDDSRRKIAKVEAHEMYVASRLRHENIVGVMGVAHFRNQLAMISPWMENGKIIAYLDKNPEADRCAACTQVSKGLAYMHENGIVHGDLKGENVLVSHDRIAQITDFGNTILAQYTLQFTASQSKKPAISARWAALELVLGDEGVNTTASDVWALGMTILEIITGEVPFHDKIHERQVYSAIMQKKLPPRPENQIPSDSNDGDRLWELITRCWTEDTAKRPDAVEVGEIVSLYTTKPEFDS